MKWLFLQLLTLYCLVISPVTGSLRGKTETAPKPPKYIKVGPKLRYCLRIPSDFECSRKCRYAWQCTVGYECCYSFCGTICMNVRKPEADAENYTPATSTTMAEFTSYMPTALTD